MISSTPIQTSQPVAVILLSGGLDSTTVLAMAREQGFAACTLAVDYGQRHRAELDAAAAVSKALGAIEHRVVRMDLRSIGGSALTDDIEVPDAAAIDPDQPSIPITYVPARNTILLGLALGYAEVMNASDLFIGVNNVDYSGYPDCRPEFINAFASLANLATRAGVEGLRYRIHTPLISLGKDEIVRQGLALGVDYAMTVSCYQADEAGRACGRCDSCVLRREGFERAGIADPTRYAV